MILAVLQARLSSRRLPGKVLLPLLGEPMLKRQIDRLRRARLLDGLVLATSRDPSDDPLADAAAGWGVPVHRGSLEDVLDRFVAAAAPYAPEAVVRITGDCPLLDWQLVDAAVALYRDSGADYAGNADPPTYPDGLDVEVIRFSALRQAAAAARKPSEREHVTPYLRDHRDRFRIANLRGEPDLSHLRWTVDEPADFTFVEAVYRRLFPTRPDFRTPEILALLAAEPDLAGNAHIMRNEGLAKSLAADAAKDG